MLLVVISSYVFLPGIKAALIPSLVTPRLALSSSSRSCLLLGTASVRCPQHLLERPSHKHVRLLSCSRSSSTGDTRLLLREAGILQSGAEIGLTRCHPLLYRNSSVIQCWQGLPEHCVGELPLYSDKSIPELFLNDDSYWCIFCYTAAG